MPKCPSCRVSYYPGQLQVGYYMQTVKLPVEEEEGKEEIRRVEKRAEICGLCRLDK